MLQCLAYLFYFQTIILVIVWRYKKGVLFTRFAPGTRPESPSPILAARYTPSNARSQFPGFASTKVQILTQLQILAQSV